TPSAAPSPSRRRRGTRPAAPPSASSASASPGRATTASPGKNKQETEKCHAEPRRRGELAQPLCVSAALRAKFLLSQLPFAAVAACTKARARGGVCACSAA